MTVKVIDDKDSDLIDIGRTLYLWFQQDVFPGQIRTGFEEHVQVEDMQPRHAMFFIYTRTFKYEIGAHYEEIDQPGKKEVRYENPRMHGTARARKAIAGEERPAEFGLGSGPFDLETWHNLMAAILRFELVKIAKQARSLDDES